MNHTNDGFFADFETFFKGVIGLAMVLGGSALAVIVFAIIVFGGLL